MKAYVMVALGLWSRNISMPFAKVMVILSFVWKADVDGEAKVPSSPQMRNTTKSNIDGMTLSRLPTQLNTAT